MLPPRWARNKCPGMPNLRSSAKSTSRDTVSKALTKLINKLVPIRIFDAMLRRQIACQFLDLCKSPFLGINFICAISHSSFVHPFISTLLSHSGGSTMIGSFNSDAVRCCTRCVCAATLSTAFALGACVRIDRRGVTARLAVSACLESDSGSRVFCMTCHHLQRIPAARAPVVVDRAQVTTCSLLSFKCFVVFCCHGTWASAADLPSPILRNTARNSASVGDLSSHFHLDRSRFRTLVIAS
jgi:hypothetical protein